MYFHIVKLFSRWLGMNGTFKERKNQAGGTGGDSQGGGGMVSFIAGHRLLKPRVPFSAEGRGKWIFHSTAGLSSLLLRILKNFTTCSCKYPVASEKSSNMSDVHNTDTSISTISLYKESVPHFQHGVLTQWVFLNSVFFFFYLATERHYRDNHYVKITAGPFCCTAIFMALRSFRKTAKPF